MNPSLLGTVLVLLLVIGAIFSLYSVYFFVLGMCGVKKKKDLPAAPPSTRFAILIAARNEETVIGQLVDSLRAQHYPKGLVDIYVAPNNCTDNTRGVAVEHGARIFQPQGVITGKGQVLTQAVDMLLASQRYDALCVFDADNLVHPDFLQKMNNARARGMKVVQGFRDSKNPTDTAVSTCYSVCYWILSKFYNAGRDALGLSALINGSGFMIDCSLLQRLGGWHTHTMTEDYEFSAQCLLAGEKVHYVPSAVIYDEQPLTFKQSWKQRRRWSTGSVQGMETHLSSLIEMGLRERRWVYFDLALTYMYPIIQLISTVTTIASAVLLAIRIVRFDLMPPSLALALVGAGIIGFFLLCIILSYNMVRVYRRGRATDGAVRGAFYFGFFLITWVPINLISIFKKKKTWDPIHHTSAATVQDLVLPAPAQAAPEPALPTVPVR